MKRYILSFVLAIAGCFGSAVALAYPAETSLQVSYLLAACSNGYEESAAKFDAALAMNLDLQADHQAVRSDLLRDGNGFRLASVVPDTSSQPS